ncbi:MULTISPECIES: hypothetical protein [Micromonospora]|uniref:DUF3592 domain-containing protein n=1 Tax=Micromonospora antibiotica TaxID=2807623 RepID=A0ABS3V4Y0_9ACTN|nr:MULTISPECIES: hypothetical protein [Micromonospora]MBO4160673.1 hypothetical protein [Micromonospora antibiotica]MBW4700736.1 hypothetical protein [Micromonospora sp. RL09-050-HVF-A]
MVNMDSDLRNRVVRPTQRILTGRVVRFMDGYPREVRIGQPVLVAVLTAASVAGLLVLLVRTALSRAGGGARRTWKDLKKGPEFLVTPLRVRDDKGLLYEVELHGHLPQSAVHPSDWVQLTLQPQDVDLPPRIERIVNLTTGQLLTPRTATVWSHLGPPLLIQAVLGAVLVLLVAAAVVLT